MKTIKHTYRNKISCSSTGALLLLALGLMVSAGQAGVVTSTNDSGPGSLRQIIADASGGDTITFTNTLAGQAIVLTNGQITVSKSLIIDATGLTNGVAIDGNDKSRIFEFTSGTVNVLQGLTLINGSATGGIGESAGRKFGPGKNVRLLPSDGGGIYNHPGSRLTIISTTLSDNTADNNGGGIYNCPGGRLIIRNSTLSGNSAANDGGGIYSRSGGRLTLDTSTLSGNSAANDGGGIYNSPGGKLMLNNCTLADNSAGALGGGIYNPQGGTVEIGSTIMDAGALGGNIYSEGNGAKVVSLGYNLSSDEGGGFLTADGDQISSDPLLCRLEDNGGLTKTHAFFYGSPAHDAGSNFKETDADQRGAEFARTFNDPDVANAAGGDGTDIGAIEMVTVDKTVFPNEVAAGDVSQSNVWLWARAVEPGTVRFIYGTVPDFVEYEGTAHVSVSDPNVPAKVEIAGLASGTRYYYRARLCSSGEFTNPASGTFRTPHSAGRHGLRFGVSSCWRGDMKPFVSMRNIPDRDLDFFVALGDTVYADSPAYPSPTNESGVVFGLAQTLKQFREKHEHNIAQQLAPEDNFFAMARASTAVFATIDDHEVLNDFAGGAPTDKGVYGDDGPYTFINESPLYKNGMQAFLEYWPISPERYDDTAGRRTNGKLKLYRTRRFGNDAALFLLDARSFRDKPADKNKESSFYKSGRTMLSKRQRDDLKEDLLAAHRQGITWKFIMCSVSVQNLGLVAAADRFEGYAYERRELLKYIENQGIRNVVFISGDIHGTIANTLEYKKGKNANQGSEKTSMWDISTGPGAYSVPYFKFYVAPRAKYSTGNTGLGGIDNKMRKFEENNNLVEQNKKVKRRMNTQLVLGNYPRVSGLSDRDVTRKNRGRVRLVEGQYLSVNTYGWTEFKIDDKQDLTVTTWGVEWYDPPRDEKDKGYVDYNDGDKELEERGSNLGKKEYSNVMSREPFIVSKFKVEKALGSGSKALSADSGQDSVVTAPLDADNAPLQTGDQPAMQGSTAWGVDSTAQDDAQIHSLKPEADGRIRMQITGLPGQPYVLEASTNLVDWEAVENAPVTFEFEDPDAPMHKHRFYRLNYQPQQ